MERPKPLLPAIGGRSLKSSRLSIQILTGLINWGQAGLSFDNPPFIGVVLVVVPGALLEVEQTDSGDDHGGGWHPQQILDGHSERGLKSCIDFDGPRAVIAHTIKGKGVSFMEGKREWHHGTLSADQLAQAREELNGNA